MISLFSAQTANASSTATRWGGGPGVFTAHGTWDTATMTFQVSFDGGTTWHAVSAGTTLTANGFGSFTLPSCHIRATLSSVGATSSLTALVAA